MLLLKETRKRQLIKQVNQHRQKNFPSFGGKRSTEHQKWHGWEESEDQQLIYQQSLAFAYYNYKVMRRFWQTDKLISFPMIG